MSRALLVLRPEPGATATATAARALRLEPVVAPLFTVHAVAWTPPASPPDAVLMTSANAARHGGDGLGRLVGLPLYAVGAATAAAARGAGFGRIVAGEGDAEAIVARAAGDGVRTLLHLAGRDHRAIAAPGVAIDTRIVYAADSLDALPDVAQEALPEAVALLHSPRAAALFARLVNAPRAIAIATLSPAVADAAGTGWRATAIAESPTDAALLAAAAKLCDHRRMATGGYDDDIEAGARRRWPALALLILIVFAAGAAAAGYAVGHVPRLAAALRLVPARMVQAEIVAARTAALRAAPRPAAAPPIVLPPSIETANAIADLREKVDDIETQARAATGDASRAEGLLVAFAARRALDRGLELGYLEALLRQRFGRSQPAAVATILSAARQPVTLADLQNGLDTLAPLLAGDAAQASWWSALKREIAGMVTIRRADQPSTVPADRVARAERLLEAGQVDGALAEVLRLPARDAAKPWIAAARRYLAGRGALDQIETAALLDPGIGTVPAATPPDVAVAPATQAAPID